MDQSVKKAIEAVYPGIGPAGDRHLDMLKDAVDSGLPWHRTVDIVIDGRRAIAEERPRDTGAIGMFYASSLNELGCEGVWFSYLVQLRHLVHHIAAEERLRPEDLLSSDWKSVSEAVVSYPSDRAGALEKLADMARAEREARMVEPSSLSPKGP